MPYTEPEGKIHDMSTYPTSISSKGQVVIPANLRKRYGLKEGTTVVFQEDRGRLVLEPGNHAAIYALQGSLAGFPLEETLSEERQAERKRENRR